MKNEARRIDKLEKHLAIGEGSLSLSGAVYLVAMLVKQKTGEGLTDFEKSMMERLQKLPLSPKLIQICDGFRFEDGPIISAGDCNGQPMIIRIMQYSEEQAQP